MRVNILNHSESATKNISIDIKFPDIPWKNEFTKAADRGFCEIERKSKSYRISVCISQNWDGSVSLLSFLLDWYLKMYKYYFKGFQLK